MLEENILQKHFSFSMYFVCTQLYNEPIHLSYSITYPYEYLLVYYVYVYEATTSLTIWIARYVLVHHVPAYMNCEYWIS